MIQDSESGSNALIIKLVVHAFDILLSVPGSLTNDSAFIVSLEVRLKCKYQKERKHNRPTSGDIRVLNTGARRSPRNSF